MTERGAGGATPPDDPVTGPCPVDPGAQVVLESHLDVLGERLGLPLDGSRQILAEATEHLYRDTQARLAAGADPREAALASVAAFGDPGAVARALRPPRRTLLSTTWLFVGLGLVAVGLSGLLASVFGGRRSGEFVAGDAFGLPHSLERCAQAMRVPPGVVDCVLIDRYSVVVEQRVVLGVVGLAVIAAYASWRRRGGAPASRVLLGSVGMVFFSFAALWQVASATTSSSLEHGIVGVLLAGAIASTMFVMALVPVLVSGLRTSGIT
jgi:hypothetical protein